ncbi:MAG: hypothetical protein WCP45_10985 [Verrucomicrobiota bacterium]
MHIPTSSLKTVPLIPLALVCLLFISLPVSAARHVRAIFILAPDQTVEKAVLCGGGLQIEIELPRRNLSPAMEVPSGDLLLAVLPKALAAGQQVPDGVPTVKIPEAWTRCLLLFFPDPANKLFPVRVMPVNASMADFPKGHTLIYNVSQASIRAKFGDRLVTVRSGACGMLKPPISKFGDYPVAIDCTFGGDPKPTAICRSSWQNDPDARQILFVTDMPGNKVPRVWGILDRQEE